MFEIFVEVLWCCLLAGCGSFLDWLHTFSMNHVSTVRWLAAPQAIAKHVGKLQHEESAAECCCAHLQLFFIKRSSYNSPFEELVQKPGHFQNPRLPPRTS